MKTGARIGRGWIAAAIAVVFAATPGCNGIASILGAQQRQTEACVAVSDCKAGVPDCRMASCQEGLCVYSYEPEGKVLAAQNTGDCVQLVCDGAGSAKPLPLVTDTLDDHNPCTHDMCTVDGPAYALAGDSVPCYSGLAPTANVGACKAGILHCSAGKPMGACKGEVTPRPETCDAEMLDEDCDGQKNEEGEGCICKIAEIEGCYTGPAVTLGIGICHGGQHACLADGLSHGPCLGEQVPSPEDCDAGMLDEDCDGKKNEEGPSCVCGDGYVSFGEACDDGNTTDQDACNPECQLPWCGDGYLAPGEACDDGNASAEDGCSPNCKLSGCGDGYLQAGESCDDGNTQGGDGCPATCRYTAVQVAAGGGHTCALLDEGRVKCWGDGLHGQLGLGNTASRGDGPGEMGPALPMVDLGTGAVVVMLAAGYAHSCALLVGGAVKCWGNNAWGQLGLEDALYRGVLPGQMGDALPAVNLGTGKKAVAIAAGQEHSCALLDDGAIKCWGMGAWGQLGFEEWGNRGDEPGEMGDALPAVNLGMGKTAVAIAAGASHSCALLAGGGVKCWGENGLGQLGLGDTDSRGMFPNGMGDALPEVNLGSGKVALSVVTGDDHSCAQIDDGLKCWGHNGRGQLGQGISTWFWGTEPTHMANLPIIALAGPVLAVTGAEGHTCALLVGGGVKCWGDNDLGQLGLGDTVVRGDEPGEMGAALPFVDLGTNAAGQAARALQVDAGVTHTCAVLEGGYVKCWGANGGALGVGDTQNRGDTPNETGDGLPVVPL